MFEFRHLQYVMHSCMLPCQLRLVDMLLVITSKNCLVVRHAVQPDIVGMLGKMHVMCDAPCWHLAVVAALVTSLYAGHPFDVILQPCNKKDVMCTCVQVCCKNVCKISLHEHAYPYHVTYHKLCLWKCILT